ncbi:Hypothetical predicted protein [Marmota monax]|uniref:Uncharacterized protein n=1 Tax=Marmota monax TaxID=9995 RepID=A0A5E4CY22_MARMO|nr:hypothetical protein GHT09_009965 [Marmota monax]VTJ85852.1 Hypothetical predicted protein [Marmota monax]
MVTRNDSKLLIQKNQQRAPLQTMRPLLCLWLAVGTEPAANGPGVLMVMKGMIPPERVGRLLHAEHHTKNAAATLRSIQLVMCKRCHTWTPGSAHSGHPSVSALLHPGSRDGDGKVDLPTSTQSL